MTNFHQPRSTLLLLVASFLGGREPVLAAYDFALRSGLRFLSYGDTSLLASAELARAAREERRGG